MKAERTLDLRDLDPNTVRSVERKDDDTTLARDTAGNLFEIKASLAAVCGYLYYKGEGRLLQQLPRRPRRPGVIPFKEGEKS